MRAKSIKGNSVEAIQVALQDCMLDGFQPTLAIVFISVKQDRKAISELLHQNQIDVFGCTSCGEFTGDHHSDGEMVMLLLDIDRQYYRLFLVEGKDTTVEAAASTLAEQALQQFRSPTFLLSCTGVFADGEYFDGDTLVRVLVDQLGRDCVFFGGMAGDDWEIKNSYVFTTQEESGHAIAALVFDGDRVTLQGIATHGWKPLGLSRKVTKSIGSKIYSIDGQPAVEMYLKYLGMEKKNGDENFDLFKDLSIHFPFIARR
ncbi:MAG TPA: FIST N-terminal domain-containing protein, partial [Chitinophagaceae bacterium]|nr:FIST N-terminal domain-containing protein [Chitinophagaceae bacterium]